MSTNDDFPAFAVLHPALRFTVLVLLCAAVLVLIWMLARARIEAQNAAVQLSALEELLPAAIHDNDLLASRFSIAPDSSEFRQPGLLGLTAARDAWRASLRGEPSGVILPAETTGFSDTIVLRIGIDAEGSITGVRVLQHRETRGLGDRIDEELSPWILAFDNRSLQNTPEILWGIKKDGGDFDQFVGATITPRAVVAAIHDALLFFDLNREALLTAPASPEPRQ